MSTYRERVQRLLIECVVAAEDVYEVHEDGDQAAEEGQRLRRVARDEYLLDADATFLELQVPAHADWHHDESGTPQDTFTRT